MAKKKKTVRAGNLVMSSICTQPEPHDTPIVRRAKSKMTTKARQLMNMKRSRIRLEFVLSGNFTPDDLHTVFTYRNECRPNSWKDVRKDVQRFIRALRSHRRARGQELKYVYTIEGKHGDANLHVHMVLNATGADYDILKSLWTKGEQVHIERISDREYADLAAYLTKESFKGKPVGAQMWTGSRNLKSPDVESYFVDNDETLTVPPNCHVLERHEEQNEFGSFSYVKYRILELPIRKCRPGKKKKE